MRLVSVIPQFKVVECILERDTNVLFISLLVRSQFVQNPSQVRDWFMLDGRDREGIVCQWGDVKG